MLNPDDQLPKFLPNVEFSNFSPNFGDFLMLAPSSASSISSLELSEGLFFASLGDGVEFC
jgi:hypothetical protein